MQHYIGHSMLLHVPQGIYIIEQCDENSLISYRIASQGPEMYWEQGAFA